jgi:hypothetical protein
MANSQTTQVLHRLLDPVTRCLTPDSARQLVSLRADPSVQERIDYLADKCTEGQLTPEERAEYETYVKFIDFIGLLQAKARSILSENPAPNGSGN